MIRGIRQRFVQGLMACALAAGLALPSPAGAAEFDQTQRSEIGSIIREYLLKNPEVVRDAFQELQRREQVAEANRAQSMIKQHASSLFRSEGDLVAGNPNGSITMVEYFDYNCGYCKRAMPDVLKLIDEDKDLRLVMKEFPILGPGSTFAARAGLASRKQGKYWDFHVALLRQRGAVNEQSVLRVAAKIGLDVGQLKSDMKSEDIDKTLSANMAVAQSLGINGTPAFIIDDKLIPGAVGYETLAGTVNQVRQGGGCKFC